MKKQYLKKIRHKSVSLQDQPARPFAPAPPLRSYPYEEAIRLVRLTLDSGKYDLGQFYLEQIVEQVNNIPEPMLFLMNIYLDAMSIDRADTLANTLLERYSRDGQVLRHCARLYQATDRITVAMDLVKKAITLNPVNPHNLELLGNLYQSIGEKEKALKAFNATLSLDPKHCGAWFAKARILQSEADEEFAGSMKSLLDDKGINSLDRALLHYGLAWTHEKNDLDTHFEHLNMANTLVSPTRPYTPELERQRVDRTLARYSQGVIANLSGHSEETLTPIFITALARSGTTLLEQMLGAHSQLVAVGESTAFRAAMKASAIAGNPLLQNGLLDNTLENTPECLTLIAEEFENHYFVRAADGKRIVDKSIGTAEILGMILLVYPHAKVINLERHPMDIIYSCYQQYFTSGNNYAFRLEDLAENYKIHRKLITHWLALFPGRIKTVKYEDLVNEQESTLRGILEFCDLEWEQGCMEYYNNVGLVKTASEEQVRNPLHSRAVNKWRKVERHLQPAAEILGDMIEY